MYIKVPCGRGVLNHGMFLKPEFYGSSVHNILAGGLSMFLRMMSSAERWVFIRGCLNRLGLKLF